MSAFDDISKALGSMPPPEAGKRRYVLVGDSALKALRAHGVLSGGEEPTYFGNSSVQYPIVKTDDFRGWEIVDRPAPKFGLAGKHRR